MEINKLYIDETSKYSGSIGYYILFGCAIKESKRQDLEKLAGQIKYKYWGTDTIVLHSQEIGKSVGAFKNLSDPLVREDFYTDLFKLLNLAPFMAFPVALDKQEATRRKWGKKRILRTMARALFRNFIIYTMANKGWCGRITVESSSLDKDYYYHEALVHFHSCGIPEVGLTGKEIADKITSISFVSKSNGDTEEQLADILAYGVQCKLKKDRDRVTYRNKSYESRLMRVLKNKEFIMPTNTPTSKRSILSGIVSSVIIP